jgi:hypothetical protein
MTVCLVRPNREMHGPERPTAELRWRLLNLPRGLGKGILPHETRGYTLGTGNAATMRGAIKRKPNRMKN